MAAPRARRRSYTGIATLLMALAWLGSGAMQSASGPRAIAFTFDDLPAIGALSTMQETTARLLSTLIKERVPATGFVNEALLFVGDELEPRTALLEA
jgi:peptidoglycan/xylan/chitin deacetylase (PgdA/CDA1 family)